MKKVYALCLGLFFVEQKMQPMVKTVIKSGVGLVVGHTIVGFANYNAISKEDLADPSYFYHLDPFNEIDPKVIVNVPALKAFSRYCHQIHKTGKSNDNVKWQKIEETIKSVLDSSSQHAVVHAVSGLVFSCIPFFGLVPAAYCAYNAQNLASTTVDCANAPASSKARVRYLYLQAERARVSEDKSSWTE
jgi:hypothetical protein